MNFFYLIHFLESNLTPPPPFGRQGQAWWKLTFSPESSPSSSSLAVLCPAIVSIAHGLEHLPLCVKHQRSPTQSKSKTLHRDSTRMHLKKRDLPLDSSRKELIYLQLLRSWPPLLPHILARKTYAHTTQKRTLPGITEVFAVILTLRVNSIFCFTALCTMSCVKSYLTGIKELI